MKIEIICLLKRGLLFCLSAGLSSGMKAQSGHQDAGSKPLRYVPLGDSYTICEGASAAESWPALMSKHLVEKGIPVLLLFNPARTGWTTQNLIDRELPLFDASDPDFTTLLIGVNDWVQGVSATVFAKNLNIILDRIQSKLKDKQKILLITIPDFSVVPAAASFHFSGDISKGITAFDEIVTAEARARKLPVVDIFSLTQQMKNNSALIARDGLHPSAAEYALWEKLILPAAVKMLGAAH
ncbi:MAG TPA: SGNH/GDSL hydrolase family protein [Bacteroidia bacterium]|jgi:lysophospholipase L1-like esterase|nr:SGNH/GDSL hydrolase family protein [Bacteroidia bacterium]